MPTFVIMRNSSPETIVQGTQEFADRLAADIKTRYLAENNIAAARVYCRAIELPVRNAYTEETPTGHFNHAHESALGHAPEFYLRPGQGVNVRFDNCDGAITVVWSDVDIAVFADLPPNEVGTAGLIYRESFAAAAQAHDEAEPPRLNHVGPISEE